MHTTNSWRKPTCRISTVAECDSAGNYTPWNWHGPWKWMVGKCYFLLGRPISMCYVSFREGIRPANHQLYVSDYLQWIQAIHYEDTKSSGFRSSHGWGARPVIGCFQHFEGLTPVVSSPCSRCGRFFLCGWVPPAFCNPICRSAKSHLRLYWGLSIQGISFKNVGAKQSTLISRLTKRSPPPRSVEEAMARRPRRLWGFLWKSGQKRGEHTRLEWSWYVCRTEEIGFVPTFVKIIDRYIHSTFL